MSSHYLLNISDLYCILCSQFILKNAAVHAAASVNIKYESYNDFNAPHDALNDDALDDDIDINNWSGVEESALAHDTCMDHNIDNSDGRDAVESKENGAVECEQCFQDKDDDSAFVRDDSAFVKDDDSSFVRNDDDSAFVKDNDSVPLLGMIVNHPNLHHLGLNLQQ